MARPGTTATAEPEEMQEERPCERCRGKACHLRLRNPPRQQPARLLITTRQGRHWATPCGTQELYARETPARQRAGVEDPDAVLAEVRSGDELPTKSNELGRGQVADQDGVLQRLAERRGHGVHSPQAPRLADVVRQKVPGTLCDARLGYRVVKDR